MNEVMKIEDALRDLCIEDYVDCGNGEKKVFYDLNKEKFFSAVTAETLIKAAELIERWRADRSQAEQYPDSKTKELQATNRKLGADLLKSQMQIVNLNKEVGELQKDLESEAEKQTRLDIMSKRIDKLESERETYKYCYEFLAACKTES